MLSVTKPETRTPNRGAEADSRPMREFTCTLTIEAPPAAVLDAFFDPGALEAWWRVKRSLCLARPLGVYAVEWESTESRDEVFGRLGGALRGTVIDFKPAREFFLADVFWLPPDADPVGPMALEATCTQHGNGTVLCVRQSGWEDSARWTRYYELIAVAFSHALEEMKRHVESTSKG
jgi:uncharacterized protein YndB with AHSA1/START domain